MSGLAVICCVALSRPRTRSVISRLPHTVCDRPEHEPSRGGDPLAEVQHEAENGLEFAQKALGSVSSLDIITAQLGTYPDAPWLDAEIRLL